MNIIQKDGPKPSIRSFSGAPSRLGEDPKSVGNGSVSGSSDRRGRIAERVIQGSSAAQGNMVSGGFSERPMRPA